jgi:hypothetical protein
MVECLRSLIDLEVAQHVTDDEGDQDDAGPGHRQLLADGRAVE